MRSSASKILPLKKLLTLRELWRWEGRVVVFTNGVFDLLHAGHVKVLEKARSLGDILVVGVNSDDSVRLLDKAPGRPVNSWRDRAEVVAALDCVDAVIGFAEATPERLLSRLRPDIHVKGGDYKPSDLPEGRYAGRVAIVPLKKGYSTTGLIKRLQGLATAGAVLLLFARQALASPTIYFLRKGEVWRADESGAHQSAVTRTQGAIKSFLFSPQRDLLAYEKIVGWEDAPDDDPDPEAAPVKTPVTTLAVIRIPDLKELGEVAPSGFLKVSLIHWTPDRKVRFFKDGQLDVIGLFEFDPRTGQTKSAEDYLSGADYSPKGDAVIYSTGGGIGAAFQETLYWQDLASGRRRPVLSDRGTINGSFSSDGRRIAYVAVTGAPGRDRYGVCPASPGPCITLYEGSARPKAAGVKHLQMSPDGRQLAMLTFQDSFVIPADKPGSARLLPDVRGVSLWLDDRHLLVGGPEGIDSYDLATGRRKLLIRDATSPAVFR